MAKLIQLTWNSDTERYEAQWNGQLMQVTGDAFAENMEERKNIYMEGGMSEEESEDKAWNGTLEAWAWVGVHGATIGGVEQGE